MSEPITVTSNPVEITDHDMLMMLRDDFQKMHNRLMMTNAPYRAECKAEMVLAEMGGHIETDDLGCGGEGSQ